LLALPFKTISVRALVLICALLACACHSGRPAAENSTREITDDTGRQMPLPARVDRVISLATNLVAQFIVVRFERARRAV